MTGSKPLEAFMLPDRIARLRQAAAARTRELVVVLDGVHDPHNLSAAVRSCEAFGLLDLHVVETQAPFRISRKVSQGAEKWLDVHRWTSPAACAEALVAQGFELWLADARAESRAVDELPFERRLALVFGNEHQGASARMRRSARGTFCVPMHGFSESLNVSVALGISVALAVRGRISRRGRHGDLPPEQQERLIEQWQRRSVRGADSILRRLAAAGPAEGD